MFLVDNRRLITVVAFPNYGIEHAKIMMEKFWKNNFQHAQTELNNFAVHSIWRHPEMCPPWFGSPHMIW